MNYLNNPNQLKIDIEDSLKNWLLIEMIGHLIVCIRKWFFILGELCQ